MPTNWKAVSPSQYPWERDALAFVQARLPAHEPYYAWSNFEFIGMDGSINEVDLLVISPQGVFLVEIKSRPGLITGDGVTWKWDQGGRIHSADNPLILANRKAKKLATLIESQKAFKKGGRPPFIEPIVFCSDPSNQIRITGTAAFKTCVRDIEPVPSGGKTPPGIMGVIKRRECPGLVPAHGQAVSLPQFKLFCRAMEQLGIRPAESSRRVGDYRLETLLYESPKGTHQDWLASHTSVKTGKRLIRLYLEASQSAETERRTLRKAAEREFQILERLSHPGILAAEYFTTCELGAALVFRFEDGAERLDHFLARAGDALPWDQRIEILRQVAEAIDYAHGKCVIHRALSPQNILVVPIPGKAPRVLLYSWQLGMASGATHFGTRVSSSLHADQLVEDASIVYLAPEALNGENLDSVTIDSFSLGALAYRIFTGQAPAASLFDLNEKLSKSETKALNPSEVLPGVPETLSDLIRYSANVDPGLRYSAREFLEKIDELYEELTAPDPAPAVDPRDAHGGAMLAHGLAVVKRLGTGSSSVVHLVSDADGAETVLKVAAKPEYNQRLRDEFDVLKKIRHENIVAAHTFLQFGELAAFTMDRAGQSTLGQRLRADGRLELEFLQRFGSDLLRAIDYLDREGIAHRDIKPDNIGIGSLTQGGPLRLMLFDFSLSKAAPENIRVGTPPYLDPFLQTRKLRRWDTFAERFSVAMTLHEMTTGAIPKWGDGGAAHLLDCEVTLQPDLFPASLREGLTAFFRKALSREYRDRYDNGEQMLQAWIAIFEALDRPVVTPTAHPAASLDEAVADADLSTPLIAMGLNTRLVSTLDRLSVNTVQELLRLSFSQIKYLRGAGHKTRHELFELVRKLSKRFPDAKTDDASALARETGDPEDSAAASVDLLAKQVTARPKGSQPPREWETLDAFIGWAPRPGQTPLEWPTQSDLASAVQLSRAFVGQVVDRARERWSRIPGLTALRDAIVGILQAQGGVMTHAELVESVLTTRGSALEEPLRTRMASVVARAAVETEKALQEPRFAEFRRDGRTLLALDRTLADFAMALGKAADALAAEESLPAPARVVQALRDVPLPPLPPACRAPDDSRLAKLGATVSGNAAVNGRLEIYPRDMDAQRALALSQNALFGKKELSVQDVHERVRARYPEAAPLPDRPDLDRLLDEAGLQLTWRDAAADGRGAYCFRHIGTQTLSTSEAGTARQSTRPGTRTQAPLEEDVLEAERTEAKLQHTVRTGGFLVLTAPLDRMVRARKDLTERFPVEPLDLDEAFLEELRAQAEKARVKDWNVVLEADATPRDTAAWRNLQTLVDRAIPGIRQRIKSADHCRLLINPGLLARYNRMELLSELRDEIGRPGGMHSLWVLVPEGIASPIPITSPNQRETLTSAWLENRHRG